MGKILQQLSAIWSRLEAPQRITIFLVSVGLVVVVAALGYGASRPDYRLLASGLTPGRVAKIAGELESSHTAYRVTDNETAILVPSKDLYRLRNVLAESGSLSDDDGFKLLDRGRMWDSTFIEHKNYDRAVASELEASFKELPGVSRARVIIDRPAPSPFVGDDEAKPKASIKLDMVPGMRLNQRQITGVVHLASGAVAGMTPDRVQVMDSSGILTSASEDSGAGMAQTTLDAEMAREAHLTRKAQDLLDTVLGPGHSQVKVSVKLDFTKRSEATSDPSKQVVLKENTTATDEKTPVVAGGGLVGVSPNTGDTENAATQGKTEFGSKTIEDTHTEYVVGKKTTTQEDEVGRIKAMSVSLLLDFKSAKPAKDDPKADPKAAKAAPEKIEYTEAEKQRFLELVLNAIGFNAAKGMLSKDESASADQRFTHSVQSIEMWHDTESRTVAEAVVAPFGMAAMREWAGYGLAGLAALAFIVIARGNLKKSARRLSDAANVHAAVSGRVGEEPPGDEAQRKRRQDIKEAIKKKVQDDPAAAAQILKKWMAET